MIFLSVIGGALCAVAVIGFFAAASAAEKQRQQEEAVPLKDGDYES